MIFWVEKSKLETIMSAYITCFLIKYFNKDACTRCYAMYFKIVSLVILNDCN